MKHVLILAKPKKFNTAWPWWIFKNLSWLYGLPSYVILDKRTHDFLCVVYVSFWLKLTCCKAKVISKNMLNNNLTGRIKFPKSLSWILVYNLGLGLSMWPQYLSQCVKWIKMKRRHKHIKMFLFFWLKMIIQFVFIRRALEGSGRDGKT